MINSSMGPEDRVDDLEAMARTLWAEKTPFDLKDLLKARGYRWNGEGSGSPKAWFIDVADGAEEAELAFLKGEIYRGEN